MLSYHRSNRSGFLGPTLYRPIYHKLVVTVQYWRLRNVAINLRDTWRRRRLSVRGVLIFGRATDECVLQWFPKNRLASAPGRGRTVNSCLPALIRFIWLGHSLRWSRPRYKCARPTYARVFTAGVVGQKFPACPAGVGEAVEYTSTGRACRCCMCSIQMPLRRGRCSNNAVRPSVKTLKQSAVGRSRPFQTQLTIGTIYLEVRGASCKSLLCFALHALPCCMPIPVTPASHSLISLRTKENTVRVNCRTMPFSKRCSYVVLGTIFYSKSSYQITFTSAK